MLKHLWRTPPYAYYVQVKQRLLSFTQNPEWLTVQSGPLKGKQLLLQPSLSREFREMATGVYDAWVYDLLEQQLPLDGKVVWDIGAHFGYHALGLAVKVGASGKVVAFEPNPMNLERLREHLARNSALAERVAISEVALSDTDGEQIFRISDRTDSPESTGGHLANVRRVLPDSAYSSLISTRVDTKRADTLIEKGFDPPDFIIVDVEGAEASVLDGARNLLKNHRPALLVEIHHMQAMFDVTRLLTALGYTIRVADEDQGTACRATIFADGA